MSNYYKTIAVWSFALMGKNAEAVKNVFECSWKLSEIGVSRNLTVNSSNGPKFKKKICLINQGDKSWKHWPVPSKHHQLIFWEGLLNSTGLRHCHHLDQNNYHFLQRGRKNPIRSCCCYCCCFQANGCHRNKLHQASIVTGEQMLSDFCSSFLRQKFKIN